MKRLYRSEENQMIAGVCGGIAEYFEIDPTIVRVLYVFLSMSTGGFGIFMYLILWAIIPSKSSIAKDSDDIVKENSAEMKEKFDTFAQSVKKESVSDTKKKSKK
ncbi:MAG: PspC domain-containing protein [Candidatus Dojkabacteria bacterium]|jgi:phage shock protein C